MLSLAVATLFLFAPLVSPLGVALAAWSYPWKRAAFRPCAWYAAALLAPLAFLVTLQGAFGLPAGSCVERPLNNVPIGVAAASLVLAIVLVARAKGLRMFVTGAAIAATPLTLCWSIITVMSLAGCWI